MGALHAEIGKRVRDARRRAGLTQAQVGERCGVEDATIRAIEAGRRGVSVDTLLKLSQALRVEPGTLLRDARAARKADAEVMEIFRSLDPSWQRFALKVLRELLDAVKKGK